MLRKRPITDFPQGDQENELKNLQVNDFTESTHLVMVLNRNSPIETKLWLISVLKNNSLKIGLISKNTPVDLSLDLVLSISCPLKVLEQSAQNVYQPQQLRRQTTKDEFTLSEQQRILLHLVEKINLTQRTTLVGLPNVTLYPGQSIVEICQRENIILQLYPLHDNEALESLRSNWYSSAFVKNLDEVRNYFGEKIGFYFAFLDFYCKLFLYTSVLCITFGYLCRNWYGANELFTLMLCLELFIFIKLWKRKASEYAWKWGTIEAFELEKTRPAFRSKGMHFDPVTEQPVPFYPITKTWCKEYGLSLPIVFLCLFIAFEVMCFYFECENWAAAYYQNSSQSIIATMITYIPSIIYALLVMVMNQFYRILATKLNDYENHRTQESHENHWIVKLILFEFVNNFMSLFYIAFYIQDMAMLQWNLVTMLTINQLVDNFFESILPMLLVYRKNKNVIAHESNKKGSLSHIEAVFRESELIYYEDSFYDYLELFIQFGYAFLFVAVWPFAPVVASVNTWMEIRLDALKFSYCMRRPFQRSARSISSAWMKSFEVLAILVVITNALALCIISEPVYDFSVAWNLTSFQLIVGAEHLFLGLVLVIWYVVPDIPKNVVLSLNRQKYRHIKDLMAQHKKFN